MDISNGNISNPLDKFRSDNGTEQFRSYFRRLAKQDIRKAVSAVNDDTMSFTSLFLLRTEINGMRMLRFLSPGRIKALDITDGILSRKASLKNHFLPQSKENTYGILKWMFDTGCGEDGLDNEYDEVMDITASFLIKRYHDRSIVNTIIEAVFKRNRNGCFKNDLIWLLFESRDTGCLNKLSDYLLSNDNRDVELARKLLGFIPCISAGADVPPAYLYRYCLKWLNENTPFLYHTGETFHQSCNPAPYRVSLEAKYLCIYISADDGNMSRKPGAEEQKLLDEFNTLNCNARNIISSYSYNLNRYNQYLWNIWMSYPMYKKIRIAGGIS